MRDAGHERIHRELFLAAFGPTAGATEAWVTDRLTALLEEQDARAGEKLFSAGDPPESYYFLREGRVQMVREGSAPWSYEGPSVFGMSDALLERPRQWTALALTDIRAMKMDCDAWIDLLEDSFALARGAVDGSVRTVADLERRLWARGGAWRVPPASWRCPPLASLDAIERLGLLTEAPILRGTGVQTLSDLAEVSEVVAFAGGEVLVAPGGAAERVLLLLEGQVDGTHRETQTRWSGGPGEIVCGTAAFGDPIAAWEAAARTPGHALAFRLADWLDLMEENFDMVRTTLGALSLDREELFVRLQ